MSSNIEDIKRRYWQGETTLEEERTLKQWYKQAESSDSAQGKYFAYIDQQQGVKMAREVDKPKTKTFTLRSVLMIAASMALVVAVYFGMPNNAKTNNNVEITDPQLALELTREALSMIGGKMDKSETIVKESLSQLDKTYLNRIL